MTDNITMIQEARLQQAIKGLGQALAEMREYDREIDAGIEHIRALTRRDPYILKRVLTALRKDWKAVGK